MTSMTRAGWSLAPILLVPILLATLASATFAQQPRKTAAFAEGSATIEHLLLQFDPDSVEDWLPTYCDLLRALPTEVRVSVAVSNMEQARRLDSLLEPLRLRLPELVKSGVPMTCWARDRLLPVMERGVPLLCAPCGDEVPDNYRGDLTVAEAVGAKCGWRSETTWLRFEGGDVLCSSTRAFVGWRTIDTNLAHSGQAEVLSALTQLLGREVVVVGGREAPYEHLDMFLTVLDQNTVALADPTWGFELAERVGGGNSSQRLPDFDTWTREAMTHVQPLYKSIEADLASLGLRVLRVPIVHGEGGRVLTWNNCLVEMRAGQRRVYMPIYDLDELDHAAAEVYREAGCKVVPITANRIAANGGTVRCITNVVKWRQAAGPAVGNLRRRTD